MKKKKLHIRLNDLSYNTLGETNDNEITYYESDKLRSRIIINKKDKSLEKDNIDYTIRLDFSKKKTDNKIILKKEDKTLNIEIETKEFKVDKDNLLIKYKVIDSNEEFILEIEGENI